MKSFQLVEDGRLSKSEMKNIIGGYLSCEKNYSVVTCPETQVNYATCPGMYNSCGASPDSHIMCRGTSTYTGQPGGGGYAIPMPMPTSEGTRQWLTNPGGSVLKP